MADTLYIHTPLQGKANDSAYTTPSLHQTKVTQSKLQELLLASHLIEDWNMILNSLNTDDPTSDAD